MQPEHPVKFLPGSSQKLLKVFVLIVLLLSVAIRIIMYLQNRNLIIDEANIARNLHDRSFIGLIQPLSYQQYAPPVFLWVEKLFALLFGYSEYALRLFPLLEGICSLFVMQKVLDKIVGNSAAWYPLCLMATGFIFIRYSSEVKQYMGDAFVTLLLIWVALKTDVFQKRITAFILSWVCAGSLAIWSSMPSVFVLAGIGGYYGVLCLQHKDYKKLGAVFMISIVWFIQFALYYFIILRPQADSSYLQNYHSSYFLFLFPRNYHQLKQDRQVLGEVVRNASGGQYYFFIGNFILMLLGAFTILRKNITGGILLVVPVIAVLIAAGLRQYSLMPRLALFVMPLLLILAGYGFEWLLKHYKILHIFLLIFAFGAIYENSVLLEMIRKPYKKEMITDAMSFLKKNNITGSELYINHGSVPAFIYYAQIHPQSKKWQQFNGAHFLEWDTNYDSLAQNLATPSAFLYSAIGQKELFKDKGALSAHLDLQVFVEDTTHMCYAYIYNKK